MVPENFTLTGMISGKTASIADAVYYPQDNRIEFILDRVNGSYQENYRLDGSMADRNGQTAAVSAQNCGIALERKAAYDEVSIVRTVYEKEGVPVYSLQGYSDIRAVVKVINSTSQKISGLTAMASCGTGAGKKTFYSEAFDIEAESCKIVAVDITDYVIQSSGDIRISLE